MSHRDVFNEQHSVFLRRNTKLHHQFTVVNSLSACGNFDCLLLTVANSLDPDQAQQNVGPDLDPNCFTL